MTESDAEKFARLRDELERARATLAEARYTATSQDGYVTAAVDAQGHVVDFEFDPRVRRLDTDDLKAALLTTITEARNEALGSREEALREVFGPAYQQSVLDSGSITQIQSMVQEVGSRLYQRRDEPSKEGS